MKHFIVIFLIVLSTLSIHCDGMEIDLSINHFFSSDFSTEYYNEFDEYIEDILKTVLLVEDPYYLHDYELDEKVRLHMRKRIPVCRRLDCDIRSNIGSYERTYYIRYVDNDLDIQSFSDSEASFLIYLGALLRFRVIELDEFLKLDMGFSYGVSYYDDCKKVIFDKPNPSNLSFFSNIFFRMNILNMVEMSAHENYYKCLFLLNENTRLGIILYFPLEFFQEQFSDSSPIINNSAPSSIFYETQISRLYFGILLNWDQFSRRFPENVVKSINLRVGVRL